MSHDAWQLAQLNIGTLVAPLESEQITGFREALDPINAIADTAPGFVWRLQDDDGDATSFRAFGDENILVNMSVWASVEALADYVFRSDHVQIMRQRRKWFIKLDQAFTVLWWIPAGHIPTIQEAEQRLESLRANGSAPYAFTFREPFPAPGTTAPGTTAAAAVDDDWLCPA
jgi:hypothetical protein